MLPETRIFEKLVRLWDQLRRGEYPSEQEKQDLKKLKDEPLEVREKVRQILMRQQQLEPHLVRLSEQLLELKNKTQMELNL